MLPAVVLSPWLGVLCAGTHPGHQATSHGGGEAGEPGGGALARDGIAVRAPRRRGRLPHWPLSVLRQIEQLLELLTTEILHPDSQAPSGVKSHFLEIFLEELSKVGAAEVRQWAAGGADPFSGSHPRDQGSRPFLSP